jgi:glycosyltransferase involved in cell wall biosynthesis
LRILTFTTLYPNAARPQFSVFVENRLRHLVASGDVAARVLAPVPYFPFSAERFGSYASFARAPRHEERFGIEIDHPRYLTLPKVGMSMAPFLLYASARGALERLLRAGHRFDLIDAHYFYPDGVAAVMLGRAFGLPVTVTARGSDINVLPNYALPRRLIRRAARQADGVIAVSSALAGKLAGLGVEQSRITVLRNGVDPKVFRPVTPFEPGEGPPPRPLAVSVGNLVPLKGHDLVISALTDLPGLTLWIVGGGPERGRLEALARDLNVAGRVRFLGVVPHERMPEVYSAADVLVLASEREGWPNVLLEAMACGTRVVTTKVSDVSDLVNTPAAGNRVAERSAGRLAQAIREILAVPLPREATRLHAQGFTWEATTRGQIELFKEILRRRGADGR